MTLFRLLPLLLLLLGLSGCSRSFDWHQRILVVIDTPHGEVVAESVQAVEAVWHPEWTRINGFERDYSMRGEAVVADLGEGRYLFVLLADEMLAERALPVDRSDAPGYLRRIEQMVGAGPHPIPPDLYPLLVTFDDITDPKTVRRVEPSDLAASFGPGVALKSVTLEITDEAVTEGRVEEVLGWLPTANFIIPPEEQPRYVKDQTVEQKLMPGDFIDWQTLRAKRER